MTERIIMLIFGVIVYCSSLAYVAACTFINIPDGGKDIAQYSVGFLLGTGISTLISYYWGSSRGSAKKTDAMISRGETIDECTDDIKKKE